MADNKPPKKSQVAAEGPDGEAIEGADVNEHEEVNACGMNQEKQKRVVDFFDSTSMSLFMGALTIYSLIGDDLLHLGHNDSFGWDADYWHMWFCVFMFVAFLSEWIAFVFCKPKFLGGFFFYLDAVATFSLVLDILPLLNPSDLPDTGNAGNMARAGRAARIGTRTGRLVRLFRLFRLFKLFKLAKKASGEEEIDLSAEATQAPEPSAVGTKLGELTTNKVVLGVMAMLLVIPFLEASDPDQSIAMALTLISEVDGLRREIEINALINSYPTICFLNLSNPNNGDRDVRYYDSSNFKGVGCATQRKKKLDGDESAVQCPMWLLGNSEADPKIKGFYRWTGSPAEISFFTSNSEKEDKISLAMVDTYQGLGGYACSDTSVTNQEDCPAGSVIPGEGGSQNQAELNMLKTLFITILLAGGSAMFAADATTIAVGPIERMITVVKKLAENPLGDLTSAEEQLEAAAKKKKQEEEISVEANAKQTGFCGQKKKKKEPVLNEDADETKMLANSIKNIGGLLQKGFGAAGAKIITDNLKNASGELDVVRPGTNVRAIYGFCDIRQFTDTTECILAQIMGFVNMTADIVHGITVEHYGAPNKNVGDAFLLVWRFDEPAQIVDGVEVKPAELQGPLLRTDTECADGALMAYHEMVCHLKKHKALNEINRHENIEKRFNVKDADGRDHPYFIRLGCGLHVGYSVEGAIGTEQKVDCSYLGLPVKVPERLQDGMKIYKNWILMSKDFFVLLSKDKQEMSRVLDIVAIDGDFSEPRHPEVEKATDKLAFNMYTHDVIPALCDESKHPFYSKIKTEPHSDLRPFGERTGAQCTMIGPKLCGEGKLMPEGAWKNTEYKNMEAYAEIAPKHKQFCRDYEKALGFYLGRVDEETGKPDQNAPFDPAKCDWAQAKMLFEELSAPNQFDWIWKEDAWMVGGWETIGPSAVILKDMEKTGYQPPAGWAGIHTSFEI